MSIATGQYSPNQILKEISESNYLYFKIHFHMEQWSIAWEISAYGITKSGPQFAEQNSVNLEVFFLDQYYAGNNKIAINNLILLKILPINLPTLY